MIIILDDTFNVRHQYSDIDFLKEDKYKSVCEVVESPTMKVFRHIIGNSSNIQLLCNHRSLKLFNDEQEVIDGKEAIQNLFIQLQSNNVLRLEFGRDMHSNFQAKTLDKDIFYSNLKSFLDNYIITKELQLKILFYGENYEQLEYLSTIDQMMDEINFTNPNEYATNEQILKGVQLLFSKYKSEDIINEWQTKGLTKKEITELINKQL